MNLVKLAEEAGLMNVEGYIDLKAGGQGVGARCYNHRTKISVVHTDRDGLEKLEPRG